MISANSRELVRAIQGAKSTEIRGKREKRERRLSACGANPWVAVFGEKSFSSPNVTLFELLSGESRAPLFSNSLSLLSLRRFGCWHGKKFESRSGSERDTLRTRALALGVN